MSNGAIEYQSRGLTAKGEPIPQPHVAVLGKGFAGLLCAYHLAQSVKKPDQVAVIGSDIQGASGISSWYVAQHSPEALEAKLIQLLGKYISEERAAIAHHLSCEHLRETEQFADMVERATGQGINRCAEGYSGVRELTGFTPERHWAGKSILHYLIGEIKKKGVHILTGTIVDVSGSNHGYEVLLEDSRKRRLPIAAENIIIAAGGLASKQEHATVPTNALPNVSEMVKANLGVEVTAMDQAIHFPFAIDQKGYLKRGLLSPAFIRRAQIVSEDQSGNRTEFLPQALVETLRTGNYRHIFPQLNTLFHEQTQRGNRVLVVTDFDDVEFERYRMREYYGHVFRGKALVEVKKGIHVKPAYHYTLGGIEVDRKMKASREGVYAIGESAFVFGEDRIIGGEYMATVTLAPLLAQEIKQQMERG
ncbi:MAG: FAD-dependent oxidoreductase [Candidatus Peribacteraceae bacterium]|nr:FAD-dependent oxidoreductase [Candidatus Peribacteraceae bacterium]